MGEAVDAGLREAAGEEAVPEAELAAVKKLRQEYDAARQFDKFSREQYAMDRRYAQGVALQGWASDANMIGSFIDILVSFLYAQNPDVSVRPSPRVKPPVDPMNPIPVVDPESKDLHAFSETLQIVISRLWRDARLKNAVRKVVRSSLSVGPGWFKGLMYSDTKQNPQVEKALSDARDNLAQVEELQKEITEGAVSDGEPLEDKQQRLADQIKGLEGQVEIIIKQGLCIDFCRAEDMQVSLDVSDTGDYLDADWISNDLYIPKAALRARFPRLTAEDCQTATEYSQKQPKSTDPSAVATDDSISSQITEGGQFVKGGQSTGAVMGGEKPVAFVKVTELWDHRDTLIKTFVDGVPRWAVDTYSPPQATTRFYPYFRTAFFPVEGARHPQSLSWRLRKLQDEYTHARSNGRLTRERSVPGTIFNKGMLDPKDAQAIAESVHQEMVGIQPTDPSMPLDRVITAKPIARVDPAMFDTGPVRYDMEVLSGVQEALQSAQSSGDKTATEAQIQQSGFASRTGSDRDILEEMLADLAQYTAEISVQSLKLPIVQKMAGAFAFWPVGMEVQDLLTMLEVEITAGTTGKPQLKTDKETWATLMPLVTNMMTQIQALQLTNPPLAAGMRNLLNETLRRLDDRLDVDDIFPTGMPMAMPGAPVPGAPGAPPDAGAPPAGNGTVNNPATIPVI